MITRIGFTITRNGYVDCKSKKEAQEVEKLIRANECEHLGGKMVSTYYSPEVWEEMKVD